MIKIEFNEPHYSTCECCENKVTWLTRFVYDDNQAFAYYHATFSHAEDGDKFVKGLIVICEWDDDNKAYSKAIGFPIVIFIDEDNKINVSLINQDEIPWTEVPKGVILNREDSLKHPYKETIFKITNHIVYEDQEIINFLK